MRSSSPHAEARFTPTGAIDVDGDGRLEWIFVLAQGGDELCHIRHACFSIVGRRGAGWSVVLRGMGGTVGLSKRSRRGHRDLIVTGANSADEQHVTLLRWRGRRGWLPIRSVDCSTVDEAVNEPLCGWVTDEFVLQ